MKVVVFAKRSQRHLSFFFRQNVLYSLLEILMKILH